MKAIHQKQRKSNAGRKPHEVTLMFKMPVLQALYNLSDDVLDGENSDHSIWADSAYRSEAREEQLREQGYTSRIHRRGSRHRKLNRHEQETNHRRSKIRARVGHVFGDRRTRQGSILVRTKGKVRAAVKTGLMNLTCNMRRLEY